jgi:hypothetical protein
MTKTEQDLKITEWLSWGLHNGVYPELLVVAATALRAALERKTSARLDAWYDILKQDEADAYIDGLIAHVSIPTGEYEPRDAESIMLDEWQGMGDPDVLKHFEGMNTQEIYEELLKEDEQS